MTGGCIWAINYLPFLLIHSFPHFLPASLLIAGSSPSTKKLIVVVGLPTFSNVANTGKCSKINCLLMNLVKCI